MQNFEHVCFEPKSAKSKKELDQIGLKRSASSSFMWDRLTGDIGRSNSILLRKKGEGKGRTYLRKQFFFSVEEKH